MTDLDRLLEGIAAAPEDSARRLVLADWLEEQGGAEGLARAELLRLQVRWEELPERDPGRWLLEEDALVRGLPDLADPLARVADPDLPLLGTGLALAAFLTAGVASQTLDALTAESAWAGTLKQDTRSYPTQLTLSSRQGNRF